MSITRQALKAVPLAGLGVALAAMLSGCGGATTSTSTFVATPDSSPVVYGLNAQAAVGGTYEATSGLAYTSNGTQIGVITGATAFKTDAGPGPLPVYKNNFSTGIPLGFSNTASYVTGSVAQALPTTALGAVVFRVYVSPGAKGGNSTDINTGSLVLTSREAPTFSQPLTFDSAGIGVGPLGQGQYTTGTFALPAALATTGLHNLHAVVADVAGQQTETDFGFLALAPTDSAVNLAIFAKNPNTGVFNIPVQGATATITNPLPTVAGYKGDGAPATTALTASYSDLAGTAILFAAPGEQTVTVTGPDPNSATGVVSGTVTVTLVAGVTNTTAFVNAALVPAAKTVAAHAVRSASH